MSEVPERFNAARYVLAENARLRADKTALIVAGGGGEERFTFAELDRNVRGLAAGFRSLGLPERARIMIRMDNEPGYVVAYLATMAAGYIALPSSSQLTDEEAAFLLQDSGASALLVAGAAPDGLPESVAVLGRAEIERLLAAEPIAYADTTADDPAYLVYTSGTTSRPKGVLHAHRAVWGRRPMHDNWLGLTEHDVMLHAGAMNWTYTLGVGIMDPWARGATSVVYNGPRDPAIWPRLIERYGATLFAAVPSVFRQLLKNAGKGPLDLPSLRHGITAGEALPAPLHAEWTARTGKPLYEALGMSEISTYISSGPGLAVKPGSPGKPQPGRRIAILDPAGGAEPLAQGETGLLAVHRSDPGLMLGYWNRPDEEAEVFRGAWFTGGDLASIDSDGYVWFHGRANDVMNALGYRVSPAEVESVLARHPDVGDVAVTELPVRADLSIIAAFVVPKEGAEPDAAALLAFASRHLAAYKCPREIVFVEALPRTANGKVQRRRLVGTMAPQD